MLPTLADIRQARSRLAGIALRTPLVRLNVRGRSDIIQVVSAFTIPLDLSAPMQVQGRSQVLGQLQGVE